MTISTIQIVPCHGMSNHNKLFKSLPVSKSVQVLMAIERKVDYVRNTVYFTHRYVKSNTLSIAINVWSCYATFRVRIVKLFPHPLTKKSMEINILSFKVGRFFSKIVKTQKRRDFRQRKLTLNQLLFNAYSGSMKEKWPFHLKQSSLCWF